LKNIVVTLFVLVLLSCSTAIAQAPGAPATVNDANPVPTGDVVLPAAKPKVKLRVTLSAHSFFDLKNSLALTAVAASLAGDGWSTQRALALPGVHEVNPVARPFVGSRAGEAAYSSAGLALVAGAMYLAHKTNHHKLERIGPFALAGWESLLTGWNISQIARARANH
jgi:hypothetical protein